MLDAVLMTPSSPPPLLYLAASGHGVPQEPLVTGSQASGWVIEPVGLLTVCMPCRVQMDRSRVCDHALSVDRSRVWGHALSEQLSVALCVAVQSCSGLGDKAAAELATTPAIAQQAFPCFLGLRCLPQCGHPRFCRTNGDGVSSVHHQKHEKGQRCVTSS